MIIKSHIRGGFRDAAAYLKEQGQNEKIRLVEMSDPHVRNLDEAFRAMWAVSDGTKAKKPLHHISINPMKDERLTDDQVMRICERLEERYGYPHGEHQRVIVEHVKEGRQHFHVIWNRVNMRTGKPHYPYMHKKQSKIAAREMETELGFKRPTPKRTGKAQTGSPVRTRSSGHFSGHAPFASARPFVPQFKPPYIPVLQPSPQPAPQPNLAPPKPNLLSGMCEAQRQDFIAACEGRITWKQYFQLWGKPLGGEACQP